MKKLVLSIVLFITFAGTSLAQGVTIYIDGQSSDVSGTTYNYNLAEDAWNYHVIDFIVNNETGVNQDWIITRSNISQPGDWSNYLCWGLNGGVGLCYPVSSNAIWSSGSEQILADSSGRLSTYVNSPSGGSATYRYYVSNDGVTFLDSVDLMITNVLSVDELKTLSVSVAPNPSSDYININTTGVNNASLKMVDVLGNVVLSETIYGNSKKIDVNKFRNGIYFLTVESEGVKTVTRKIIVRH